MSSTATAAKRDIQKLQRVIFDALDDVKAIDIRIFNTEHLSPLFERVIIASGTSNRQTQALASSVRDAVREAGFDKPRLEGHEVGEWIIVDCGTAVVHVMQPAIRAYYHLEDIWGEKPVKIHGAAPKKLVKASEPMAKAKKTAKKSLVAKDVPAKKAVAKTARGGKAQAGKAPAKPTVKTIGKAAKTSVQKDAQSALRSVSVKRAAATQKSTPIRGAASTKTSLDKQPGIKRTAVKKSVRRSA